MKVNFARRAAGLVAAALVGISVSQAEEVISLDQLPPATTELIVSDNEPPAALPAVPADMQVDPAVQPAGGIQTDYPNPRGTVQRWMGDVGGPERPPASAGIQRKAAPRLAAQQPAMHAPAKKHAHTASAATHSAAAGAPLPYDPRTALHNAELPPRPASSRRAAELLVDAHELSKSASSQAEYSKIVRACAEAIRLGLDADTRPFALQLSAWALNRRGEQRADEDQLDLAMADFSAAIDFDPTCWRALHNRSVSYAQAGHFAEAFDDVSRVIQLNPTFAKALSNRAMLYVQAGETAKALADFDAAIEGNPQLTPALVGKARLCHMQGKLDDALKCFDAAVESAPKDATILCSRADLLTDLGRYQQAMKDYAHAIQLDSRLEHAYRNGAWLLATCPDDSVRDVEGALAGAKKALECGYGDRHAALDTLAAALASAGRWEEAVGTIEQAIEVAPEEVKPAYQARLSLYESHQPYRSAPASQVQRADYVVGDE